MSRWLLLVLALGTLSFCAWIWFHGETRSGASALAEAEERLAGAPLPSGAPGPDERARELRRVEALAEALRNVHEALDLARAEGDGPLVRTILVQRAAIYQERRQLALALDDCRAILAEFGPEAEVLERACRLALELRDPGAALDLARMLRALDGPSAEVLIGKSHVALADGPLAEMERLFANALADVPARDASRLAQKAAVYYHQERVRTSTLDELFRSRELSEQRRDILELVRAAADHLEEARGAFLRALQERPDGETIAGLQDLLLRADADEEVADLGSMALALRELDGKTPVLARTAGALQRLGRVQTAKALILAVRATGPQAIDPEALGSDALRDELVEWCRILDDLALWGDLGNAAMVLFRRAERLDDARTLSLAHFYFTLVAVRQQRPDNAQQWLARVLQDPPRENDIPLRIWLVMAEIARAQGERIQERYALNTCTKSAPLVPETRLEPLLGEAWRRLAELQEEDGDLGQAVPSMTHALRLLPLQAVELEKRWHELGRRALEQRSAGPYGLWTFASQSAKFGDPARAQSEAEALLVQYPGLRPALEIVSECALLLRDHRGCIEASLTLLEKGQPSPEASARLCQVPEQFFTPEERVRWMRADPKGSLEDVIPELVAAGRSRVAVEAASTYQPRTLEPAALVVVARTLANEGRWKQAHETLSFLDPATSTFRENAGLVLCVGLQASRAKDQPGPLDQALEVVLESEGADDPELLDAADLLLAAGEHERLRRLLEWIEAHGRSGTGQALLREAVVRAIERSATPLDEALERSIPFFEDGRAELGRVLVAVDAQDWDTVEREARVVLQTPLAADPIVRILLAGLSADFALARMVLERAAPDRDDPALALGLAALAACERAASSGLPVITDAALPESLAGALDPRTLLALVLASEIRPWSAWALARWRALPEDTRAEPAAAVMRALALLELGELDAADLECRPWTGAIGAGAASVPGAWTVRARILEARPGPSAPEAVFLLRAGWLEASGLVDAEDPRLAELQAEVLARSGRREEGVRRLERAREALPADRALLAALARIEDVPGRRTRSIELYGELFRDAELRVRSEHVLGFLDVLRAARDEGEISEARWWNELEALEAELPAEPAIARELAAHELSQPADDAGTARERAYERLRRFRSRTMGAPVESLRRGESLRWTRLYARNDPARALEFAWPELIARPTDADLWLGWSEALIAAQRRVEALTYLEPIVYLAPAPEIALPFALLRYELFANTIDLDARLRAIARSSGDGPENPLLRFYRGIAQLGKKPLARDEAFADLEVWRERETCGLDEPRHGRAFALALQRAGFLVEALTVIQQTVLGKKIEPFERDMLLAMASLVEVQAREQAESPELPQRGRKARTAAAFAPADGAPAEAPPAAEEGTQAEEGAAARPASD